MCPEITCLQKFVWAKYSKFIRVGESNSSDGVKFYNYENPHKSYKCPYEALEAGLIYFLKKQLINKYI